MNEEFEMEFDLSSMSEDEKDQAIVQLVTKYNSVGTAAATLFNCMSILSARLQAENVFGRRTKAMDDIAIRMRVIANLQLPLLGFDLEQLQADAEFERITAQLEEDDE